MTDDRDVGPCPVHDGKQPPAIFDCLCQPDTTQRRTALREEMESKVAEIATSFWSKFAREKVIRLGERDILWKYGSPILELNEGGLDDPKAVVLRTRRTLLLSTDLEEHIALYHAFVEGGEQIKEAVEEACVSKHTLFLGWDFRRQCPSLTRYLSED